MTLSVKCPNCGKQLRVAASHAGKSTLCPACGMAMKVPGVAPLPPALPLATPQPVVEEPPLARAAEANPLNWLAVAAVAILVVWGATWAWQRLFAPPTWEEAHHQQIEDLLEQSRRLAEAGQSQEAYKKLKELDQLVTGNPINDASLSQAIENAQRQEDQLLTNMLNHAVAEAVARAAKAGPPQANPTQQSTTSPTKVAPPPVVETLPPGPTRPAVHPIPPPPPPVGRSELPMASDDQIGRAIKAGAEYLMGQWIDNRIHNNTPYSNDSVDALAVYALLQAGQATHDSRLDPRSVFMTGALDWLKNQPFRVGDATYGRALRANALQLAGRHEDRDALETDLQWLLHAGPYGAYTYTAPTQTPLNLPMETIWDNSNSQYGLLGVWAAAEGGLFVPPSYWIDVQKHWLSTQLGDGQWGYDPGDGEGRASMTLAGLASLFVTQDYLNNAVNDGGVSRLPFTPALAKGMKWLDTDGLSQIQFDGWVPGYTSYGLERVGLASGFKYFGSKDWYRELATEIVALAKPDGSWGVQGGDEQIETSFALLFLARGRHPIVMNKLSFDGFWNNRPRDVANLARYIGRSLERPLNWQVVPADRPWQDWADSPILYLASHTPPKFSIDVQDKIKQFILNGGVFVTHADASSVTFNDWAINLGKTLFPNYSWGELPPDSPLFSSDLKLKDHPDLMALGNGARIFWVHLPKDISNAWQLRAETLHPEDFNLMLNLFVYANGRGIYLNRLQSNIIPEPSGDPAASIQVVTPSVSDDSNPEPDAWPRFARWFRWQTNLEVKFVDCRLEDMTSDFGPMAHLTGVLGWKSTESQQQALRKYVEAGGVVLIDPCGGPNEFLRSVREDLLPAAFPNIPLNRIGEDHPLLNNSADGMSQLTPLDLRDYVRSFSPPIDRGLWMLRDGKGCVIVSSLDITSGLLGTNTWGIAGFTPTYCLNLAKNVVLWTWDGAKD
jgi:Domain of unknown function (DUF4159)